MLRRMSTIAIPIYYRECAARRRDMHNRPGSEKKKTSFSEGALFPLPPSTLPGLSGRVCMHARVGVREIHYATQQLADTPQRRALPVLDPSPELIYLLVKPLRLLHQRHRLLRVLVRRLGILKRIQRASCIIDDTQGSLGKGGAVLWGRRFPRSQTERGRNEGEEERKAERSSTGCSCGLVSGGG